MFYIPLPLFILLSIIVAIVVIIRMHRLVYSGDRLTKTCFFSAGPNVAVVIDHGTNDDGQSQDFQLYISSWNFFPGPSLPGIGRKFVIAVDMTVQRQSPPPIHALTADGIMSQIDLRYTYLINNARLLAKNLGGAIEDQWAATANFINEVLRGVVYLCVANKTSLQLAQMSPADREMLQENIFAALNIALGDGTDDGFGIHIYDLSIVKVIVNPQVRAELERQQALKLALVTAGIEKDIMKQHAAGMRAFSDAFMDSTRNITWPQALAMAGSPLFKKIQDALDGKNKK